MVVYDHHSLAKGLLQPGCQWLFSRAALAKQNEIDPWKELQYLLILRGPSPGEPTPPLMQVARHLVVHDSAFLDFGRWILGFLQSLEDAHSPESVWGMLDRVSESWGTSAAPAAETIRAAAARKLDARWHLRLYLVR